LSVGALVIALTAAAGESRPISLEDCIQLALEHNLDVRIQKLAPDVARFDLNSSLAAYDPRFTARANVSKRNSPAGVDPQNRPYPASSDSTKDFSLGLQGLLPTGLSYTLTGTTSDSDLVNYGVPFSNARTFAGISLSQPILRNFWIDGPRLNIALSRNQLHISRLQLEAQLINTITQVELAYFELIAARETVKVQEKAVQLAEQLWKENKKRVAVGVMAPLDEKQAESQLAATRAALLGARNNVSLRQSDLKALLDDRFSEWYSVELIPTEKLEATAHTFSLADSWSRGLTLRPDLQQAKTELENRNITLKYRKNQVYPQLDLVGSYGLSGSAREVSASYDQLTDGDGYNYSVGLVFSMPLSNRDARNRRRAAQADVESALLRLKQLEQQIMVQIHDAVAQARTSYEQVEATRAAVDYAQQALDAEQKKLENGKSTSFQVLQLQRDLTARESEHIRAVTDFNAALARLAQAEGSTLERHHIQFNPEG
jgi:outer membrane protein TolC